MAIRHRISGSAETIQDYELAAEDRYWDGMELLVAGHTVGGLYLLGFAAEMWLKYAYFRFTGARPGDPARSHFGPARSHARQLLPSIPAEGYHSLAFWAGLLRETRQLRSRAWPTDFDASFVQRCRRAYGNWLVDMRYRRIAIEQADVRSLYDDVSWIRTHRVRLWR